MILTLPGDNSTWPVTLWAPASDRPLKEFRHPQKFSKVVQACPLHAHWLNGEPITDVLPMGGASTATGASSLMGNRWPLASRRWETPGPARIPPRGAASQWG
jgi:hypothetical protein